MASTGITLEWTDGIRLPDGARRALIGPGAPFELVVEDVLGVPTTVFAARPRSLRDLLVSAADRFGDLPYLTFPDRELSFRSVLAPVAAAAALLRDRFGVTAGDRVGIFAANCAEYVVAFWAATSLGAVTVGLNGWWTGPEAAWGLDLTRPRVLLGDRRRLERLDGLEVACPSVVFEDESAALLEGHGEAPLPDAPLGEDDPFLILFTSGTTGRPKGALLSHRNNIHFIQSSLLGPAARAAILAAESGSPAPSAPAGEQPCVINASPMFHISGLNCQVVMAAATGMRIVYPPPGRWREDAYLELTERYRPQSWALVPTQLWRLLDRPDLDRYDLSSVRSVGGGSAVWAPELLRALERRMPWARPGLSTGYGMTETNGVGTSLRVPDTYDHPDSIGAASPGSAIQVRGTDGSVLGEDEVGEICIHTAATFLGYWDDPAATRDALDADRWYRTGDHGFIRDGFVHLRGRRRDLIIRGGENIYPIEIENRLVEHPDIAEAAVIGVDHPTLGQEVKAVIVARDGSTLTADDVRGWVAGGLASFKVPTHVELVDALPHNASGKVMKHLLEHPRGRSGFVEE